MNVDLKNISLNKLQLPLLAEKNIIAAVLRLDQMHPEISGNKWFKLKEYLKDAKQKNQSTIVTFGGAYSNHILATAAACKEEGLSSIGIIRGEKPNQLSQTLLDADGFGMNLVFVSREDYRAKKTPSTIIEAHPNAYIIPEGGSGNLGVQGAQDILSFANGSYTHILAAVGTGTTLAGLTEATKNDSQIIGISVLKNHFDLAAEINALLSPAKKNHFRIVHDYAFGGYAKYAKELLSFMNNWYEQTAIPSDFAYTGKLFYAFKDLCQNDFFPKSSNILLIHSGGLQGNRSLPKGTLIF